MSSWHTTAANAVTDNAMIVGGPPAKMIRSQQAWAIFGSRKVHQISALERPLRSRGSCGLLDTKVKILEFRASCLNRQGYRFAGRSCTSRILGYCVRREVVPPSPNPGQGVVHGKLLNMCAFASMSEAWIKACIKNRHGRVGPQPHRLITLQTFNCLQWSATTPLRISYMTPVSARLEKCCLPPICHRIVSRS